MKPTPYKFKGEKAKQIAKPGPQSNLLIAIFVIMLIFIVYDVSQNVIPLSSAILGILLGSFIGFVIGRILYVWTKRTGQVLSLLKVFAVLVTLGYAIFLLSKAWIFERFSPGSIPTALVFTVLAGLAFGVFLSITKIKSHSKF